MDYVKSRTGLNGFHFTLIICMHYFDKNWYWLLKEKSCQSIKLKNSCSHWTSWLSRSVILWDFLDVLMLPSGAVDLCWEISFIRQTKENCSQSYYSDTKSLVVFSFANTCSFLIQYNFFHFIFIPNFICYLKLRCSKCMGEIGKDDKNFWSWSSKWKNLLYLGVKN